jgi:hypothetical protein
MGVGGICPRTQELSRRYRDLRTGMGLPLRQLLRLEINFSVWIKVDDVTFLEAVALQSDIPRKHRLLKMSIVVEPSHSLCT